MSKKGGTIVKIVAVVAGIAAVGTACYVYKDKIVEFFQKLKLKEKVDSVKSFVDENVLGKKDDDYFDDADFFDDDSDAVADRETGNRGYTSITITTDDSEEEADDEPVKAESEDAPQSTEATKAADAETDVEEYENEGLSDTSEDEDALADEAALDGASPEEI